jgi:hypothetical protein
MGEQTQASGAGAAAAGDSGRYRDWTAIQDLMPGSDRPRPLRVGGDYHLNRRGGGVSLRIAVPQGIIKEELLLDLVAGPGNGGDWVPVRDEFRAEPREYTTVKVTDSDGESITIEVEFPV